MTAERMRRARFIGGGQVRLEEVARPSPGRGELLLRVDACGLCGSDRAGFADGSPVTPGHETSGTVIEAGPGTAIPAGATGSVFLVAWCGQCSRCLGGGRGACLAKEAMLGFDRDGGLAEAVLIPERCFLPLPRELDADDGVALLDTTGTALHALRRAGAVADPPAVALVVGAGPLGLGLVLGLQAIGVERLVVAEPVPYRRELAARLGATIVVDPAAEPIDHHLPDGAPLVLDASGHPRGQRAALDAVAPGGRLVFVGHAPQPLSLSVSDDLIVTERTILGSEYFDDREFPANLDLVLSERMAPRQVVTHRFPLERVGEAYERFWSGETGKVVIHPSGLT